jgi:curved DNA-binding protein CbpA
MAKIPGGSPVFDPYEQLGLDPSRTTDEAVQRAYKEAIRRHPPDRDPQTFERIRNAYEQIKNERDRLRLRLFGLELGPSFFEMLPDVAGRPRVGAEMWLAVIEAESRREARSFHYGREQDRTDRGERSRRT